MSISNDFLFEIGVEELPPKSLVDLESALVINVANGLKNAALEHANITSFATPRRLAILIENLAAQQPNRIIEQRGPSLSAAFSSDGTPTQACIGFAKACNVPVEKLERITTDKGSWVGCKITKIGAETKQLMPEIISNALKKLPIPKSMRWGEGKLSFVRPVHWLVMLHGAEIINCEILGVLASNKTYGNRFHHLDAIIITAPKNYEKILQKHKVIASFDKRKEEIVRQIAEAKADYGIPIVDENLLDEVTGLVEWPRAIVGSFATKFLHLPQEILILCMQKQQRYFPITDDEKQNLAPYFIAIINIESKNPANVIKGNEKVLRARLTDAEFFYNIDSKFTLDSYFDHLKAAVFQTNLGSLYDKTLRLADIAFNIAQKINANSYHAKRAAELSKADLMTSMVGEFPELQGIIGYYYALKQKEPQEIATALKEQYLPKFAGDTLPETDIGCALALADRFDNLIGVYCLNKLPTGEKDPFGQRRAALGILRIILKKKLPLDVRELLHIALKNYRDQIENFDDIVAKNYLIPSEEREIKMSMLLPDMVKNAFEFVLERMRVIFAERGISANVFAAIINAKDREGKTPAQPLDIEKRLEAVMYFLSLPEAQALSIAHKRVSNILANASYDRQSNFDEKLVEIPEETELFKQLTAKSTLIYNLGAKASYKEALIELAKLKSPIDNFFDKVMVMAENIKIRTNRLILLDELHGLLTYVADIALLQI